MAQSLTIWCIGLLWQPAPRHIGRMIISPGRNYIFVHIPKTGGTSMALALEARAKSDDILIGDTPKARRRRSRLAKLDPPGRLWKHSRLRDIDGMPELPDQPFIFTMVRNPWDRMVSLYHWSRTQDFDHPLVRAAQSLPFRKFILSSAAQLALQRDAAASYVTDPRGRLRCDAFIRLEALPEDLAPLETHLGFRLELPHVNRSDHPPTAEHYDAATRDHVGKLFAPDIARFEYRFPEA